MLSRIIERTSSRAEAELLTLDRVNEQAQSSSKHPTADVAALTTRIAELEHSLAKTEASAYARGRREAEAEAQQRYAASMQSTAERLGQAVKQLADVRPRLCKEAETDLLRLALAIAQRILHRELNMDVLALEALVKVSLERLGRQEQICVRVNPTLADAVRAILAKQSRSIEVTADSVLESGGLVFETTRGQLDASIRSQLDEIERGLVDHLENR